MRTPHMKVRSLMWSATIGLSFMATACGVKPAVAPVNQPTTPPQTTPAPPVKPKPKPHHPSGPYSTTTGLPVKKQGGLLFSATVENSPAARPQTGLYSADIVYEMEAEGTITRYLAIFHDTIPALVGPMRSARPYFITTARDYGTPFVHFGGSPQAYRMLKTYPLPQIDGIYQGQYFTRDSSRFAPHNAYLHTDRLPAWNFSANSSHFRFGKPNLTGAKTASTVSIDYNSFTRVRYEYNAKTHEYMRYQDGAPDDDRVTGKQIYTNNIVVQYTVMKDIPNDPKERITIDLNGPGKAIYYMDGKEFSGTWRRNSQGALQYLGPSGNLVTLTPGKTWIQVVDNAVPVSQSGT